MSTTDPTATTTKQAKPKPTAKAKPKPTALTADELRSRVEAVAAATKLDGLTVELRQNNRRPVITRAGRTLAYVDPRKRDAGFRLYLGAATGWKTADTVQAAAKLVKANAETEPARKPAVKAKPTAKAAAKHKPAAKTPAR